MTTIDEGFTRIAPPLTERTAAFWNGGADGVLRIARCDACGTYMHPPQPVCRSCRGRQVSFEPVSGRGVVHSWTLNRYPWNPVMTPPYVVASVELAEQAGLRLLTNLVDVDPADVSIGMEVEVCFACSGEAYIPLFRPAAAGSATGDSDGQG